tara:strand:+ start:548 stop:1117 length:570 start_codon:yes stop_codon:yes gene_type:complete
MDFFESVYDFMTDIPVLGDGIRYVGEFFGDSGDDFDIDLYEETIYGDDDDGGVFNFLGDLFDPSSPGGRQTSRSNQAALQLGIMNNKAIKRVERLSRLSAMKKANKNMQEALPMQRLTRPKDIRKQHKDTTIRPIVKALNGINGKADELTAMHTFKQMQRMGITTKNPYGLSVDIPASTLKDMLEMQEF